MLLEQIEVEAAEPKEIHIKPELIVRASAP